MRNCRFKNNREKTSSNAKKDSAFISTAFYTDWNLGNDDWYMDSGASQHLTGRKKLLVNYNDTEEKLIKVSDGNVML